MIEAYGPDKLRNSRQEDLSKCIEVINSVIKNDYGPKVMIDLEMANVPFLNNEQLIIDEYTKAGWSKVEIYSRGCNGPEWDQYLHPPYHVHIILRR